MAHILSDGKPIIKPMPVDAHCRELADWMEDQTPRVLGAGSELTLDLTSDDLIYILQPTRVIARKQVERNLVLIQELLARGLFRKVLEKNNKLQIVLHITGPTPIEHQDDHEIILDAYENVINSVPSQVSNRIFLAFSVGQESHHSFFRKKFRPLYIEDIYRMATVVVFPSEREGRGLPIIEASASGIPIICSRYSPDEVFAEVVGEDLSEEHQIDFVQFPKGAFPKSFLQQVTQLLLYPELNKKRVQHNKNAVRSRFSARKLEKAFGNLLEKLRLLH
jgi:glycosyltransferase involved in cell wall biosynthesis